jgi:hypothetical protein
MEKQPFNQFLARLRIDKIRYERRIQMEKNINSIIEETIKQLLEKLFNKTNKLLDFMRSYTPSQLRVHNLLKQRCIMVVDLIKLTNKLDQISMNEIQKQDSKAGIQKTLIVDRNLLDFAQEQVRVNNHNISFFYKNIREAYKSNLIRGIRTRNVIIETNMRVINQYIQRGFNVSTLQRTTLLFGKSKNNTILKQLILDLNEVTS